MEEINTQIAPPSIGPFFQAIRDDGCICVSGQGLVDPESGEIVGGIIEERTKRNLENVTAIFEAADRSLDDIAKATVFVRDMDNFSAVTDVYADYMTPPYPARNAIEGADLPDNMDGESEGVAID